MDPQPHDFTRPPQLPPEVRTRLAAWLNRSHAIFAESLSALGLSLSAQSLDQTTVWPLPTFEGWTGLPIGFRISFGGTPTILVLPNRLAQSIVAGLLGDSLAAEPSERELTSVEQSLVELVVATFVDNLREAWLEESVMTLELRDREPNLRRSKLFRPNDPLVLCRSTVKVLGGEHLWSWLVPLETILHTFVADVKPKVALPDESHRKQMEVLVRDMNLPMTVQLGHANLTPSQLRMLQVGDVVVLQQRANEPLKAMISGKPAFLGWPGRIGHHQAFQIETQLAK